MANDGKSGEQILQELDALSHTMYQAHGNRRHASLALPRGAADDAIQPEAPRPRSRRLSMTSPFRSRSKLSKKDEDDDDDGDDLRAAPSKSQSFAAVGPPGAIGGESNKKKGIWGWKPMRALSHIGMTRLSILFSVEVAAAQGLPSSMDGLRLAVAVRKKESRDGAVQTMPSRVHQGAADFEETLFLRCHVYCSSAGSGKPKPKAAAARFEPRPFLLSVVAVDAPELDLGRSAVDLSLLVKESTEKSQQGERIRQWDMAFPLAGKAKGGELVVKLAFQVMEDGGVGLYSQPADTKTGSSSSSLFARKQSKNSFSITSPKVTRSETSLTPAKGSSQSPDLRGMDDFKLDDSSPIVPDVIAKKEPQREPEPEEKADDSEFPEFDVVDKGIEGEEEKAEAKEEAGGKEEAKEAAAEEGESNPPAAGDEVVKEVVHDSASMWRINELEAITNQIKALESMMLGDDVPEEADKAEEDEAAAGLDADEEEVTREFLQLLEQGGDDKAAKSSSAAPQVSSLKSGAKPGAAAEESCYVSDLGKGLGPVVQTRDGGYLAATNPFDIPVARKELPKLAMLLSMPFILRPGQKLPGGGAEVFQRLCAGGMDALCAKLGALTAAAAADEVVIGKTAEQIAFEGMASAIISARSNKEHGATASASSSAAQSVSLLRTMSSAMSEGRRERIATGIWNAREAPMAVDEILAFSLQKIEAMAIEALKVQAGMADEQAPFEVSPGDDVAGRHPLDTAVPPEEWATACAGADAVTMLVVAQLRDPLRRYEVQGVERARRGTAAEVGRPA